MAAGDDSRPGDAAIRSHLEEVLEAEDFRRSPRQAAALELLVEAALRGERITAGELASSLYGNSDERFQNAVRNVLRQLRMKLPGHYETNGRRGPVSFRFRPDRPEVVFEIDDSAPAHPPAGDAAGGSFSSANATSVSAARPGAESESGDAASQNGGRTADGDGGAGTESDHPSLRGVTVGRPPAEGLFSRWRAAAGRAARMLPARAAARGPLAADDRRPRRRALVRRAAMLSAGTLLCLALLLPFRLEIRDEHAVISGPLGWPTRKLDTPPLRQTMVLPLSGGSIPWARRDLAVTNGYFDPGRHKLGERRFTLTEYPSGLIEIDKLTGTWEPFVIGRESYWSAGFPLGFPLVARAMHLASLRKTLWPDRRGTQHFLARYEHKIDYPGAVIVFDADGEERLHYQHPGRIGPVITTAGRASEPDDLVLAFPAQSASLSYREVVIGFSLRDAKTRRVMGAPPFTLPPYFEREPGIYTLLGASHGTRLALDDASGDLIVETAEGESWALDSRTGAPRDERRRGGIDERQWLEAQKTLMRLFGKAAMADAPETDGAAADAAARNLAGFARAAEAGPSQRGAAAARAAELMLSAGDTDEALALARLAVELEPGVWGHRRLLFVTRFMRGEYEEGSREYLELRDPFHLDSIILRDFTVAALAENDLAFSTEKLLEMVAPGRIGSHPYALYCKMLVALHRGDVARVLQLGSEAKSADAGAMHDWLVALASLLVGPPRGVAFAGDILEREGPALAGGNPMPFAPLRAFLSSRGHGDEVPHSEVQLALREQRRAARSNLVSWYFEPWGLAFAGLAAAERGEFESATSLLQRARGHRAAGPWLDLLIERTQGRS